MTLLTLDNIPALQSEVRALAAERGAVILAHNYQLPEVQDVADFVGDSLGLSQQAAQNAEISRLEALAGSEINDAKKRLANETPHCCTARELPTRRLKPRARHSRKAKQPADCPPIRLI